MGYGPGIAEAYPSTYWGKALSSRGYVECQAAYIDSSRDAEKQRGERFRLPKQGWTNGTIRNCAIHSMEMILII